MRLPPRHEPCLKAGAFEGPPPSRVFFDDRREQGRLALVTNRLAFSLPFPDEKALVGGRVDEFRARRRFPRNGALVTSHSVRRHRNRPGRAALTRSPPRAVLNR